MPINAVFFFSAGEKVREIRTFGGLDVTSAEGAGRGVESHDVDEVTRGLCRLLRRGLACRGRWPLHSRSGATVRRVLQRRRIVSTKSCARAPRPWFGFQFPPWLLSPGRFATRTTRFPRWSARLTTTARPGTSAKCPGLLTDARSGRGRWGRQRSTGIRRHRRSQQWWRRRCGRQLLA
jgi:hypothetical protein